VYLVLAAGDFNVQNHLAFSVNSQAIVDGIWHEVEVKGGKRLYEDEYPYADGHGHYAAYFLDPGCIKFEIVWVSDSPR
jgi:predicted lactoylglutathione lyase